MSMKVILGNWLVVYHISAEVIVRFPVLGDTVSLFLESLSHQLLRLLGFVHVLVVIVGGSVVVSCLLKPHFEVCNSHILHVVRRLDFLLKFIRSVCLGSRCDMVESLTAQVLWETKVGIPGLLHKLSIMLLRCCHWLNVDTLSFLHTSVEFLSGGSWNVN